MDKSKDANPKEINIIIKKGKRNKPQEAKIEKKEEKIVKKNNNILNKKPKNKISRFQTLVFPISQINGKIKFNKKKSYNLINIHSKDVIFIIKLILKESHNFSPVKSRFKKTLIFTILCLLSLFLGIFFFYKKIIHVGFICMALFILFGFIYLHKIRKSINNNYKKLQKKLFQLTDNINRKFLAKFGYYLLIDSSFRFIGIYIIPGSVRSILLLRDHNIEIKKNLEGGTIDQMGKNENYVEHPKYEDFRNNFLFRDIKDFTLRNYNNNYNKKNDAIFKGNEHLNNKTLKNNKIKFNNFFKENKKDLIDKDDTIDISLSNKDKIRLEYASRMKYKIKKNDSLDDSENDVEYYKNNNDQNVSKINNRSIDKFKSYFGNSYNGIDLITN
jgi:hypothetical protein